MPSAPHTSHTWQHARGTPPAYRCARCHASVPEWLVAKVDRNGDMQPGLSLAETLDALLVKYRGGEHG